MVDTPASPFDVQPMISAAMAEYPKSIVATRSRIGDLENYIQSSQANQMNIPALQFAAGLLAPTRTGSFGESVGTAAQGALGALSKQREIDLDRQSKLLQLEEAKQNLIGQQVQTLMPFYRMQMASSVFGGDGMPGMPSMGAEAAPEGETDPTLPYRAMYKKALMSGEKDAIPGITALMNNDPKVQAYLKRQTTTAEEDVKAEHNLVEVTGPDGGKYKVPASTLLPPKAGRTAGGGASSTGATAAAGGGAGGATVHAAQTELPVSAKTSLESAAELAKGATKQQSALAEEKQNLEALSHVYETYEPGAFAEPKAELVAALRGAGLNIDDSATANPEKFQQATKYAVQQMFKKAQELTAEGGGQIKVAELTGLQKTQANPDLQPGAVKSITAQALGVNAWKTDMVNDYAKAYEKGEITKPATWREQWLKDHPLGTYVEKSLQSLPVMGVSPEKVPVNGLGVAPKGGMKDSKGNVTIKEGDKYIKLDNGGKVNYVPLDRLNEYYQYIGQEK